MLVVMDYERETARHATTAFVWGVLGFWLWPWGAILAFVYARRAERLIRQNPEYLRGVEMAESARSLARAQLALYLIIIAIGAGVWIAFADWQQDLARLAPLD
jgi:hypothetical protein